MIVSIGELLNHLARLNVVLATNPAAKAGFPVKNLKDGFPTKVFKWGIVPTAGIDGGTLNRTNQYDLCLVKNPIAALGISGYKKAGAVIATTAEHYEGAKSWRIPADGYILQTILARSGEYMQFDAATLGDGAAAEAYVGIQDVITGKALDTSGNWVTPDTDVGTGTSKVAQIKKLGARTIASWLATNKQFRVQTYDATNVHLTQLRIVGACGGTGNAYVGKLAAYPATDWAALISHNFPANMLVRVYSSDTGVFGGEESLRFILTPLQPTFHQYLDSVFYARYIKVVVEGVRERDFLPWIGEFILTQKTELEVSARYGSAIRAEWLIAGKAPTTPAAAAKALTSPSRPVRTVNFPFRYFEEDHWPQARELFINRARGEREEILIAAPEFESTVVIYGTLQGARGFSIVTPDVRDSEPLQIQEKELAKPQKGEKI